MSETPDDSVPLDLDMLMTLDPLKLSEKDISIVIQYHRNIRAAREAGKGRKAGPAAAPPKGVKELLNKVQKPAGGFVNRRGF